MKMSTSKPRLPSSADATAPETVLARVERSLPHLARRAPSNNSLAHRAPLKIELSYLCVCACALFRVEISGCDAASRRMMLSEAVRLRSAANNAILSFHAIPMMRSCNESRSTN